VKTLLSRPTIPKLDPRDAETQENVSASRCVWIANETQRFTQEPLGFRKSALAAHQYAEFTQTGDDTAISNGTVIGK
jgi:hypothetical protein